PEAHELPRRLKALAVRAGKPWLNATLTVKSARVRKMEDGSEQRPGLTGSGMFLVNPPYTLHAQLEAALPQMAELLGQDEHAGYSLQAGRNPHAAPSALPAALGPQEPRRDRT